MTPGEAPAPAPQGGEDPVAEDPVAEDLAEAPMPEFAVAPVATPALAPSEVPVAPSSAKASTSSILFAVLALVGAAAAIA